MMKILNKTQWDTNSLKKLFSRALREDEKIQGKLKQRKHLIATITTGRYSGYAFYNGNRMRICIPNGKPKLPSWWNTKKKRGENLSEDDQRFYQQQIRHAQLLLKDMPQKLSRLFLHELDHIRGYHHREMPKSLKAYDVEWAKGYQIIPKQVKAPKQKEDIQLKRYNHVLEIIETKQSILKRTQKQMRKWMTKKRYYERVLTVAGKIKKEG